MAEGRPSKQEFERALGRELEPLGYRRAGGHWRRDLPSGFQGTVAIGWAPMAGWVDVQAGVRAEEVQRFLEVVRPQYATVIYNLRNELDGHERLAIRAPAGEMARSVAGVLREHGRPWQERIGDLADLETAVRRHSSVIQWRERHAAILAAAGRAGEALAYLDAELAELGAHHEAIDLRDFAAAFRESIA